MPQKSGINNKLQPIKLIVFMHFSLHYHLLYYFCKMIKFLTIGFLLFLLYRFVAHPRALKEAPKEDKLDTTDDDFVDYEEID